MEKNLEAIIIGGGVAGLSAALTLSRINLKVAVIDAGQYRNALAEGVHGLLGREGVAPLELVRTGRREIEQYGAEVFAGRAEKITGDAEHGFTVEVAPSITAAGDAAGDVDAEAEGGVLHLRGKRILLATGLTDELPAIPGLAENWGRTVIHCPFCHGWEVRRQAIGVLATRPGTLHQVKMFRLLSDTVTWFLNEQDSPDEQEQAWLDEHGVQVVRGAVSEVEFDSTSVTGARVGEQLYPIQAMAVATSMSANTGPAAALGVELAEVPMSGGGEFVVADTRGATNVPGVWAAGNASSAMDNVTMAIAAGHGAAMGIVMDVLG